MSNVTMTLLLALLSQAECQLSASQKARAVAKRQAFYQEMGRLLRYREQLLRQLERSAIWLDEATGGEVELLLSQPSIIARQAVSLVQQLRQTIEYQQYLMRTFSWEVALEVMTPLQHAILVVRCLQFAPITWTLMLTFCCKLLEDSKLT